MTESSYGIDDASASMNGTLKDEETPPLETKQPSPETTSDNNQTEASGERQQDKVHQYVDRSQVGIVSAISATYASAIFTSIQSGAARESQQGLDVFVRFVELQSPGRTYQSLSSAGYSGCLQAERILLLSCHDEDVALSVAKSIAYETKIPSKELVNIDENGQGRTYTFSHLIDLFARPKEKQKHLDTPVAIYVWDATDAGDDEIASGILHSLLSANSRIENYKVWLAERGVCLICLVSPQRIQKYTDTRFTSLRNFHIDFLNPLLEHYHEDQYETLADTIRQQRQKGRWSEDDSEFYREISKHLKADKLPEVVQSRAVSDVPGVISVEDLFNREDPITDTILYCAAYFPDLSPQDFSYLVEMFLGEATEEVTKRVSRPDQPNESDLVVTSVPLVNRWRRDADSLLRQCKLEAAKKKDDKRVIDFKTDGLRRRLSNHIRNEGPFFYEKNFTLVRQQGLLFSPKRVIAEGARQLFVDTAKAYVSNDVANWLYEIVYEFEEMSQANDRLQELTPLFHLLPDVRVKAARRYLSYGLSRVLIRLDKDDALHEASRLFWQKLVQSQHQWFIDVLRRMGDSTPPESLKWVKQLLDQGTDVIRRQACGYLVNYLLHRDSSTYQTLKELMEWPESSTAGRLARQVLIIYCAETNRQVRQQDYGRWPSSHPLFAFQHRAEAEEWLDLLIGWVWVAASEVDDDQGLFVIADLIAGWFLILSSSASEEPVVDGESPLTAPIVRDLLFNCIAGHMTHRERHALTGIWDRVKNDILDRVLELDTLMNHLDNSLLNVENISTARRKLLDTRASLSELRNALIETAAAAAAAQGRS